MKLLLVGGTSLARKAASLLMDNGHELVVSVAESAGLETVPQGAAHLVGRRDREAWLSCFAEEGIEGVVDCTHPFAVAAQETIRQAAEDASLAFVRVERPGDAPEGPLYVSSAEVAAERAIDVTKKGDLVFLALGVRLLPRIVPMLREAERRIFCRVLPTTKSMADAVAAGMSERELCAWWGYPGRDLDRTMLKVTEARCMLAKDSGDDGGVTEKWHVCRETGIPLVLIERPVRPDVAGTALEDLIVRVAEWCKSAPARENH